MTKEKELTPLFSHEELISLRTNGTSSMLFSRSVEHLREKVQACLDLPPEVPGQGEAGSPEHNRHQLNARLLDHAGVLFQLTGEAQYAKYAGKLLERYAEVYPTLGFHAQRNTNPPGHLFHQILNEHMWLLYAAMAYGNTRETLGEAVCRFIETNLFEPMLELFTRTYAHDFDRIHNHGLWAVAAVGICGIALDRQHYVDQAINGLAGDREKGGFLAQIGKLFAPSGYYVEGPYYHRFAIRPLCLFAEALHRHRPQLDIFSFNDGVIGASIRALLMTAYPDGRFPALNDASRTMNIADEGVLIAMSTHHAHYGAEKHVTAMARQLDRVWIHASGLALAQEIENSRFSGHTEWPSIELYEGECGSYGAQGILRARDTCGDVTQVIMAYGQHGMGHGHFDTLGLTCYNHGDEMLCEYGFARWINVESKFGGRYLPENRSYARQTVAHNCVTVDGRSQNGFDVARADASHGLRHFFSSGDTVQAMSARAVDQYPGVLQQRSVFVINTVELQAPLIVDLFRLVSHEEHQYDYCLHYAGQVMDCTPDIHRNLENWPVLGDRDGYQHLLEVARADVTEGARVTWLQGERFNSWLTAANGSELIFTQTGANDPSFNLRREDGLILRQRARTHLFASVFETHGHFDEAAEQCYGSRGHVHAITVVGHNDNGSVIRIDGDNLNLVLMVSNLANVSSETEHNANFGGHHYSWKGAFSCRSGFKAG